MDVKDIFYIKKDATLWVKSKVNSLNHGWLGGLREKRRYMPRHMIYTELRVFSVAYLIMM